MCENSLYGQVLRFENTLVIIIHKLTTLLSGRLGALPSATKLQLKLARTRFCLTVLAASLTNHGTTDASVPDPK